MVDDHRHWPRPGDRVPPYVIAEQLDEAIWYRAFDADGDDGPVELSIFELSGARAARLFERENGIVVAALRTLSHPAIRPVHAVGVHIHEPAVGYRGEAPTRWIGWLASAQDNVTPLPIWRASHSWVEVLRVLRDVGEAVAALETTGILGDVLFPEDIRVGSDGQVRVDLGNALAAAFQMRSGDCVAGHRELRYMPPERIDGAARTSRTTQYVLSLIAWEMLFGAYPYTYSGFNDFVEAVHRGRIDDPPIGTPVPRAIQRALARGLAPDPADRWPSITAWVAALRPSGGRLLRLLGR